MDKFLGILFFYSIAFNETMGVPNFSQRSKYLNEKSLRYLNHSLTKAEWELLNIYLTDIPRPNSEMPLTNSHISTLIHSFDKVFGLDNIDYELRMYGSVNEDEIINSIYDDLGSYISIVGSSNGISLRIGKWLSESMYDRQFIERETNLIGVLGI